MIESMFIRFLSTDGRRDKYLDEPPYAVLDSGEFDYRIDERNQIQDGSLDNGKIASFQMRRVIWWQLLCRPKNS